MVLKFRNPDVTVSSSNPLSTATAATASAGQASHRGGLKPLDVAQLSHRLGIKPSARGAAAKAFAAGGGGGYESFRAAGGDEKKKRRPRSEREERIRRAYKAAHGRR